MISDENFTICDGFYPPDSSFLIGFKVLMIFVVPAAMGYMLWRIFVTNRTPPVGISVLGLNESSETYSELCRRVIPWRTLLLYVLAGVTLAYEALII